MVRKIHQNHPLAQLLNATLETIMKLIPDSAVKINSVVSIVLMIMAAAVLSKHYNPVKAWILASSVGITVFFILIDKYIRRYIRHRKPFPEQWRLILEARVGFYRKLSEPGKSAFEQDVRIFLDEQHIYGSRGHVISDEIRLLIAASAATLGFGLPNWEWPDLRDILVFPTGFDEDYDINQKHPIKGMVHQQGPIIFSEDELQMGFVRGGEYQNVGLHEMAHVLDMAKGNADGVPTGLNWMATAPWIRIMADRIQKVRRGECIQILREYAGVNEAEFFAVAVEVFFQRPAQLRRSDPELFGMLQDYFGIDPEKPESPNP